jgi:hypothetical protein
MFESLWAGLLAVWHLVFWVWGIWVTAALGIDGSGPLLPDQEQVHAIVANAAIAACFNFWCANRPNRST